MGRKIKYNKFQKLCQATSSTFTVDGDIVGSTITDSTGNIRTGITSNTTNITGNDNKIVADRVRLTDLEATYTNTQVNTQITNEINDLIDSAPGALNTLSELANALGDDANYATTTVNALATKGTLTQQNTNTSAISLNTAKTGISSQQTSDITANNAKTGISSGQASAITANTAKTGISSQQTSDITANNAKTGISSGQTSAITANTAKTGISSGQASAITANTDKTGISSQQTSDITANNAKTGISSGQASAITANTDKTGISSQQTSDITANNAKTTYDAQSAVSANTAKTGISSGQTSAITANTAKTGISSGQTSAITANTAKTGISSQQTSDITANNDKTGISSGQTSAITANTAKTGISSGQASAITANTAKTGISSGQTSAITANTAKRDNSAQDNLFDTKQANLDGTQLYLHSGGSLVGVGTDSPNSDSTLTIHGSGNHGVLALQDSRSQAQGVGGSIQFRGIYNAGTGQTVFASIKAKKENGTVGNYGSHLELQTRANGTGNVEVGFTVNSDQTCKTEKALTIGAYTLVATDGTDGQTLTTDGSGNVGWESVSGGIAASDATIDFTGAVSFTQPIRRVFSTTVTSEDTYDDPKVLSATVAAYVYAHADIQSSDDNTYWVLPASAPIGTRLVCYTYTGGEQNGYIKFGTEVEGDQLRQSNNTSNKNGWDSGSRSSDSADWVSGKKNDKKFFTKILANIWTT